ncbi:MAG: tRNA (guanosine(37)-N1)-methyltransferase TrmD [Clostridia bacterium]
MKIKVLTLFPEMYQVLDSSIIGRAIEKGTFSVEIHNIRDYSTDKHKKCDDYPFGGGAGMVMTPQPLHSAITNLDSDHKYLRIYLSPKGKKLDQQTVERLAKVEDIMLINGSYEGIDQRIIETDIDEELSIGDYVLTNGDYGSLVVIDSVARYIPDVLGSDSSTIEESFSNNMLEYPHYTRPRVFEGKSVPSVLLSGNHKKIEDWRNEMSNQITKEKRPDLLEKK